MSKRNKLSISSIYQRYYSAIPEETFKEIVSADVVSSNWEQDRMGMYAKWLLRLYKSYGLKLEDLYKAKSYFTLFEQLKKSNTLAEKDINKYNSLANLYRIIKPFMESEILSKSEKERELKKAGADKVYEDETFIVVHPKTRSASVLYGKGTQWCTAAKKHNVFNFYNSRGKLYILIDKVNNRKYQFHFETDSFMDDMDDYLSITFLHSISATNGLIDFFVQERPERLFVLEFVGHAQTYLVRMKDKYGFAETKYRLSKFFNYENGHDSYVDILTFNLPVKVEFDYAKIKAPAHVGFLKKGNQLFIYNFVTNLLHSLEEIESSLTTERVSLQNFISSIFSVQRKDMVRLLESVRFQEASNTGFVPNCIIASQKTITFMTRFLAMDEKQEIDAFAFAQKLKNITSTKNDNPIPELDILRFNFNNVPVIIDNQLPYLDLILGYSELCENRLLGLSETNNDYLNYYA